MVTSIIVAQQEGLQTSYEAKLINSFRAMAVMGVGELTSGLTFGPLIDKLGSRCTAYIDVFIVGLQTAVALASVNSQEFGSLTFAMCFLLGFQDGATNIHLFQLLGSEFDSQAASFSVFNMLQGLSVFLFMIAQTFIDLHSLL